MAVMVPCLDGECEWEVVRLCQLSDLVIEGGGLVDLPECTLEVLALWPRHRIAAVASALGSFWSVACGRTPLRHLGL